MSISLYSTYEAKPPKAMDRLLPYCRGWHAILRGCDANSCAADEGASRDARSQAALSRAGAWHIRSRRSGAPLDREVSRRWLRADEQDSRWQWRAGPGCRSPRACLGLSEGPTEVSRAPCQDQSGAERQYASLDARGSGAGEDIALSAWAQELGQSNRGTTRTRDKRLASANIGKRFAHQLSVLGGFYARATCRAATKDAQRSRSRESAAKRVESQSGSGCRSRFGTEDQPLTKRVVGKHDA